MYHVFPMPKVDPPSPSNERVADSQPQSSPESKNETPLPQPLGLLLDSIKSTLRSLFTAKPPHTVQRLAELILHPNTHYRTLPAYLRALDRVVCVTSSAEVFQLQSCQPNGVANGGGGEGGGGGGGPTTSGLLFDHAPGSDEALGGALLTPIPWLGSISFEGDTEGSHSFSGCWLLGIYANETGESVPIALHNIQEEQLASQAVQNQNQEQGQERDSDQNPSKEETTTTTTHETTTLPSHPITTESETAESEELPHARGPPVVGVEDMGLQDGKGVEMPLEGEDGDSTGNTTEKNEGDDKDGDGDISLEDARKKT